HLRGYAQKDPFQEYRREASEMFRNFLNEVTFETVKTLSLVQIEGRQDVDDFDEQTEKERPQQLEANHPAAEGIAQTTQEAAEKGDATDGTFRRDVPKVGRNEPCPCGSGKKYKQCCGKLS
ncbi:MAG TPA: preprotein translocase subunit SecA, partial [Thiomicrospira sp.]|nr:preprotein translocase subunit SecA [Thiomicrospira sp.]